MNHIRLAVTVLCVSLAASVAAAKDRNAQEPMDRQAMMEAYARLAKPGEPHRQLAALAGGWTTRTKESDDSNTQTFEMYGTQNGKEMKMIEITYTRKP